MAKRDIRQEILNGIQEINAFKAGQGELRTRHDFETVINTNEVEARIRNLPYPFDLELAKQASRASF